jgi:hypothetical protein
MSNTPTEAHRKLATDLCRNATGSNRALHHVSKFAQLIADSEARACDQLRAEVERLTRLYGCCVSGSTYEATLARAERAEAEVERLKAALAKSCDDERELSREREKVRVLRNAMKYLLNDDNYIDPQFDPCALASKAFEVTRDAK